MNETAKKKNKALLLAFEYIGDRSAGSNEAWEALALAIRMDPEEVTVEDMLRKLREESGK